MLDQFVQVPSPKDLLKPKCSGIVNLGKNASDVHDISLVRLSFTESDNGCITAVHDGSEIFASAITKIKAGEVWDCLIDSNKMTGKFEAIGVKFIRKEKTEPSKEEFDDEEASAVIDAELISDLKTEEIERLERTIEQLRAKSNTLLEQNRNLRRRMEDTSALEMTVEQLQDELENERIAADAYSDEISSAYVLRKQVKALNSVIESKDAEIEMLKEKLRRAGISDDSRFVPAVHGQIVACMTSPSRIFCRLLSDGRYSVRFNPMAKQLCFEPNETGTVECRHSEVFIPGLSAYSDFQCVKNLNVTASGDCVTVDL